MARAALDLAAASRNCSRSSVPTAGITHVRGQIDEVLPTPTATSGGTAYQAVIGIAGHEAAVPLDGMAADVKVGS